MNPDRLPAHRLPPNRLPTLYDWDDPSDETLVVDVYPIEPYESADLSTGEVQVEVQDSSEPYVDLTALRLLRDAPPELQRMVWAACYRASANFLVRTSRLHGEAAQHLKCAAAAMLLNSHADALMGLLAEALNEFTGDM